MKKNDVINRLAWIIINAAAPDGYISSNDLDFANDCLDKVQGQSNNALSRPAQTGGLIGPQWVCSCGKRHWGTWCAICKDRRPKDLVGGSR